MRNNFLKLALRAKNEVYGGVNSGFQAPSFWICFSQSVFWHPKLLWRQQSPGIRNRFQNKYIFSFHQLTPVSCVSHHGLLFTAIFQNKSSLQPNNRLTSDSTSFLFLTLFSHTISLLLSAVSSLLHVHHHYFSLTKNLFSRCCPLHNNSAT